MNSLAKIILLLMVALIFVAILIILLTTLLFILFNHFLLHTLSKTVLQSNSYWLFSSYNSLESNVNGGVLPH